MIFLTVGSQKFQFKRLLQYVDDLVIQNVIQEPVFAQIGNNPAREYAFEYEQFMDRDKFKKKMAEADIVITHAGTGAIVSALEMGKKVIAIPRKKKYGEHVDDHQQEISNAFQAEGYIEVANTEQDLRLALIHVREGEYKAFRSNTKTYITYINKLS